MQTARIIGIVATVERSASCCLRVVLIVVGVFWQCDKRNAHAIAMFFYALFLSFLGLSEREYLCSMSN